MSLPRKIKLLNAFLLSVVVIACVVFFNFTESDSDIQSTDDAYIHADYTIVAPEISGIIDRIFVSENQAVKKGDLLVSIDDRDFVIAVRAAKAQVDIAKANINKLQSRLKLQETVISQSKAEVAKANASLRLANVNRSRYRNLAKDGSGSVQAMQQAEAQMNVALANHEQSQAGLLAAQQQVQVLLADLEKAKAVLDQAQTVQSAAELRLSYTRIVAPVNGVVGHKTMRVGGYANSGKPMLAIVPLDDIYIEANYRETQLARVTAGQLVDIEVDALRGEQLKGVVESMGPATGVSYSSIPPHNATGNFTKIVQRIPVRIRIEGEPLADSRLKVGMSVTTNIRIE